MTTAVERMRASIQAHEEQDKQNGQYAGGVFANHRADYEDLLILRKVVSDYHDDDCAAEDDLLGMLFKEYRDRRDYDAEDFNRHLFGDENAAEPSGSFVSVFVRAALDTLEAIAEQAKKPAAA